MTSRQRDQAPATSSELNDLRIYDDFADRWWSGSVGWLRTLNNMVPARLRYFDGVIGDWQGKTVLDIGCGGGFMAEALADKGASVIGIDPAEDAIRAARAHADERKLEIDYRVGTGENLPFNDESFDAIVCVDVLEHVADVNRVITEAARVSKSGSLFLFDTINRNPLARLVAVFAAERVLRLLPRGTHDPDKFITPGELKTMLEQAGFSDVSFAGLGPTGINRRFDLTFGRVPTTLVQYMGHGRRV
ncbi:MAG: bifunctional 2-polyprenyl-6-hydroxyphenol methylase/3-demethylubiquinol 3-O-methyltransferase UbiG [Geminicoccaceae bacterium]